MAEQLTLMMSRLIGLKAFCRGVVAFLTLGLATPRPDAASASFTNAAAAGVLAAALVATGLTAGTAALPAGALPAVMNKDTTCLHLVLCKISSTTNKTAIQALPSNILPAHHPSPGS